MAEFKVPILAIIEAESQEEANKQALNVKEMLKQDTVKWALLAQNVSLVDIAVGSPVPNVPKK